jgi:urease accessory protein
MEALHDPVDVTLIESGGDNLTAIFSKGLVDIQILCDRHGRR